MKSDNGKSTSTAHQGTVITVKADLLSPLEPLLEEINVSQERKNTLLKQIALQSYNRGHYVLRDALMFALNSL